MMRLQRIVALVLLGWTYPFITAGEPSDAVADETRSDVIILTLTHRTGEGDDYVNMPTHTTQLEVEPSKIALFAMDMWTSHPDWVFTFPEGAMTPRVNQLFAAARELGIKVIFGPSNFVYLYEDTPQRRNAKTVGQHSMPPLGSEIPGPPEPYDRSKLQGMELAGVNVPCTPYDRKTTGQNPEVVMEGVDFMPSDRTPQELHNICARYGIEYILYTGGATNMCVINRPYGMMNMQRYGYKCIIVRDITWASTKNKEDYSPEYGTQKSIGYIERYYSDSIDSSQLLKRHPQYRYANCIYNEPGLTVYHRMAGNQGYRAIHDAMNTQGGWLDGTTGQPPVAGITFGIPGAIRGDSDTAIKFDGGKAIVLTPCWQEQLTTNSPLLSLSAGSFSVEAWVQIDGGLGANQWILSHDDGTDAGIDFLLGLGADNRFRLITRANSANAVVGSTVVTQADIDANRWFHVVGVQDAAAGRVQLFIDGAKEAEITLTGTPVSTRASLQIGSRGAIQIDPDGPDGTSDAFISNFGFEFMTGVVDEVAIYRTALPANAVLAHWKIGTGPSTDTQDQLLQSRGL